MNHRHRILWTAHLLSLETLLKTESGMAWERLISAAVRQSAHIPFGIVIPFCNLTFVKERALARPSERSERFEPFVSL